MPHYVPCRTEENDEAHLFRPGDPDRALCGKRIDDQHGAPDGHEVCRDCGKRLLKFIFDSAGGGAITSVDVTVN